MAVRVEPLTGAAINGVLPEVARLRMAVFREWPYLYDGTVAYEEDYLSDFARAPNGVVVTAWDREAVIGAATASPLTGHTQEFVPLFAAHGFDPDRIFYFGESVLLPAYRGQGIGHAFFDHREAHAAHAQGQKGRYTHAAFCAVIRDPADARRPGDYRPLDEFWTKRGYRKVEGLTGTYSWKEIGHERQTDKPMQFWIRAL